VEHVSSVYDIGIIDQTTKNLRLFLS